MSWLIGVVAVALVVWAFAEAFVWPVVPDFALAAAAFLLPEGAVTFTIWTVVGSVVGGVTAITAYRHGFRWPLPTVTSKMKSTVASWLTVGPIGLFNQPLTAVPYKVFVVEGARRGFPRSAWAWWTALFRGTRMAMVTFLAVLGSRAIESAAPSNVVAARSVVLAIGLFLFVMGWRFAWSFWSDSPPSGNVEVETRTMQP